MRSGAKPLCYIGAAWRWEQHLHSVYNCVEPQFLLALDMDVELPGDRNPHLVGPWARGVCECEHVPWKMKHRVCLSV